VLRCKPDLGHLPVVVNYSSSVLVVVLGLILQKMHQLSNYATMDDKCVKFYVNGSL